LLKPSECRRMEERSRPNCHKTFIVAEFTVHLLNLRYMREEVVENVIWGEEI